MIELNDRELFLLRGAMHMAGEEGGWEWPRDATEDEFNALWTKIGGLIKHITMQPSGTPSYYWIDPRWEKDEITDDK